MREDLHYFPHICDLIVSFAPPAALPALRAVSPLFAESVDRRLLEHIVYGVLEARLASALLPGEPLVVRPELVRVLDLAMSLQFAGPGAALAHEAPAVVAGLEPGDELWSGNAKAPWVLANPPSGGPPSDEVQLADALPHFPRLRALRCLNYQPVVFPHLVRFSPVPVVVYPAWRAISWSPSRRAGGRIVGGGVRAPRAVIAFRRPPRGDFSFYFRANQHERLDIVLLPGEWEACLGGDGFSVADALPPPQQGQPPGYDAPPELPGYTANGAANGGAAAGGDVGPRNPLRGPPLVDRVTSGTFWTCLTDEVAHHVENGGACTVVGLEAWDAVTRASAPAWDGAWADIMVRDVAVDEMEDLGELGAHGLQRTSAEGRLAFAALEDWRAADENADVWPLIA